MKKERRQKRLTQPIFEFGRLLFLGELASFSETEGFDEKSDFYSNDYTMRLVIQQVQSAKLDIEEDNIHREIGKGIIIYLGIHVDDLEDYQDKISRIMKKLPVLKCLTGSDGNIDTSLQDISGEVLLVSNFTLFGRSTKGTKLDFVYSAPYQKAKLIYDYFIEKAKEAGLKIQTGEFGADMIVSSVNIGPLNYVFDY